MEMELLTEVASIVIQIVTLFLPKSEVVGVIFFIISMIKLPKLSSNFRKIEVYYIDSQKKMQYWSLMKVVLFNIFFAHFVASILLAMSLIDDNNWIVSKAAIGPLWW